MSSVINTLHTYDTVYSADSVEWCPHSPYQHLFVCGTYQLDQGDSLTSGSQTKTTRKGRILLFGFDSEHNLLTLKQTTETSAVLDQKWHPTQAKLSVVTAHGEVLLYGVSPEEELVWVDTLKIPPEDPESDQLALALDWSSQGDRAVVSDSKGGISIINFGDQGMQHLNQWSAHSFEAWTCAFDRTDHNVLYTGGDDTFLCIYDIRCLETPVARMKNKNHEAGVTSLLSFTHQTHLLATGSYDDRLRIFDTRSMKSCVSDINLGGGVWRLKSNPSRPEQVLCACMYHNFSVVTVAKDHSISLDAEYDEHGSICYGCDWSYGSKQCEVKYFATCSFYDHKLCLAVLKTEE